MRNIKYRRGFWVFNDFLEYETLHDLLRDCFPLYYYHLYRNQ